MKKRLSVLLMAMLMLSMLTPLAAALNIRAESAFVMDVDTGEALYSHNGDTARVPASMTKVLTAYIVYQEIENGAQPNYITARSQAKLTRQFIMDYPAVLSITSKPSYTFDGRTYNNTNHLLNTMSPYEGLEC